MKTNNFILVLSIILIGIWLNPTCVECFVPAVIINKLVEIVDKETMLDFGKASQSYSHDSILRRGIIRSVARYFYDQPSGNRRINLNNLESYQDDICQLYQDYYGRKIFFIELNLLLELEMEPNVAIFDFDTNKVFVKYNLNEFKS